MVKKISFGKIAYSSKRKVNPVDVKIELRETENGPVFTCSANVWNHIHTHTYLGGQCLDDLVPYLSENKLFMSIHDLWKRNHLNNLNPGTKEQMQFIEEHKTEINEEDGWYLKELNLLKKYGLDVVEYNGKPYKYGTDWIYRPISDEDLATINSILES